MMFSYLLNICWLIIEILCNKIFSVKYVNCVLTENPDMSDFDYVGFYDLHIVLPGIEKTVYHRPQS